MVAPVGRWGRRVRHAAKERRRHSAREGAGGAVGGELRGHWYDDTKAYLARQRGEELSRDEIAEEETVYLTPLPCSRHLGPEAYRHRVTELVADIEQTTVQHYRTVGDAPRGATFLIERNPHDPPASLARSPAPAFHAASKAARRALRNAYALFHAAFRQAADRLASGELTAPFPAGSFPPALPFVSLARGKGPGVSHD